MPGMHITSLLLVQAFSVIAWPHTAHLAEIRTQRPILPTESVAKAVEALSMLIL